MFWNTVTKIILRNRLAWLVLIGLSALFMGYMGRTVETSYEFAKLMPETDSVSIEYNMLVEEFGQASNTVQQYFQIRGRDRDACFKAFLDNNRVGLVVTLGILASVWMG